MCLKGGVTFSRRSAEYTEACFYQNKRWICVICMISRRRRLPLIDSLNCYIYMEKKTGNAVALPVRIVDVCMKNYLTTNFLPSLM